MALSYEQKRNLIGFLTQPSHWQNVFDMAYIMREERRWKGTNERGISILRNNDASQFIFHHDRSKSSAKIQISPEGTLIECDAGAHIFIPKNGTLKVRDTRGQQSPIVTAAEIGIADPLISILSIPDTSALIRFHDDGSKTIFCDRTGTKVTYGAALKNQHVETLKQGQFFHTITLPFALAEDWGMSVVDFMNGIKLVLSRDFDLHPDLKAKNALDFDANVRAAYALGDAEIDAKIPRYDMTYIGPWQWRPKLPPRPIDIDSLRLPWEDSTEFTGHYIDTATLFRMVREDNGVTCQTKLDQREILWTQASIFNAVSRADMPRMKAFKKNTQISAVLNMLEQGHSLTDHRNRAWQYVLLEAHDAPHMAFEARRALRTQFGLSAYQFTAINFERGLCLLAMDKSSLTHLINAYGATTRMMALIKSGAGDSDAMEECLVSGASLRYIDPEAAMGARSFVDVMVENKQTALLAALMARNGRIHTTPHP